MWELMVVLVRLPVTVAWLAFATIIGVPFIVIGRTVLFGLGYVVAPFVLIWHAFNNDKAEYTKHMEETDQMLSKIPQTLENMYKEIFRWGNPF